MEIQIWVFVLGTGFYVIQTMSVLIINIFLANALRNATYVRYINSYMFRHRDAIIREILQQRCISKSPYMSVVYFYTHG